MRLPRVRFTVRRLMIAVAVVAIGLGAKAIHERRETAWFRSSYHNRQEHSFRRLVGRAKAAGRVGDEQRLSAYADYHRAARERYVRLFNRPWTPDPQIAIEPD